MSNLFLNHYLMLIVSIFFKSGVRAFQMQTLKIVTFRSFSMVDYFL